jgi:hypothetical protein
MKALRIEGALTAWRVKDKKAKFSLYLIKHYAMKTYGEVEIWLHHS